MKILKKIFKAAYFLFLSFCGVVALLLIFSVFPLKGNYLTLVVLSGSMEPKIGIGSIVAVKPSSEYKVGDVITFGAATKKQSPTTHRIVEIKNEKDGKTYVTKGDANDVPDQKTAAESEILGKVFFTVPYLGYAVNTAQKPIGFVLLVVVPTVIIIYDEFLNIKKEIARVWKKRKEKKMPKEEIAPKPKEDTPVFRRQKGVSGHFVQPVRRKKII